MPESEQIWEILGKQYHLFPPPEEYHALFFDQIYCPGMKPWLVELIKVNKNTLTEIFAFLLRANDN